MTIESTEEADDIALYTHLLIGAQNEVKGKQRALNVLSKEAKAHGVQWGDVKAALKEYELSPQVRQAKAEQQAKIYQALGVPVQLELFDAYITKPNDTEGEAERKGRFAAICHGAPVPPYDAGSPEGQAWLRGWHSFQELVTAYRERFAEQQAQAFQIEADASAIQ